jgi:hypothetical protein
MTAFILLCPSQPGATAGEIGAVIIGIADYDRSLGTIPTALNDAEAFKRRLIDLNPSAENNIVGPVSPGIEEFRNVVAQASERFKNVSHFIFYFSGHGILFNGEARLLPKDYNPIAIKAAALHHDAMAFKQAIEDNTIRVSDIIARRPGQYSLFILDACQNDVKAPGFQDIVEQASAFGSAFTFSPGTFDGHGKNALLPKSLPNGSIAESSANLGRDVDGAVNILVAMGAVRNEQGDGLSYWDDKHLQPTSRSIFTDQALYALAHPTPPASNAPISATFPSIRDAVVHVTTDLGKKPYQLPYIIDRLPYSATLASFARGTVDNAQWLTAANVRTYRDGVSALQRIAVAQQTICPILSEAEIPAGSLPRVIG